MNYQAGTDSSSRVTLGAFEELRGRLQAIDQDHSTISIVLSSGTLRFAMGTPEANICERELLGEEGAYVSILRVPVGSGSLRVRIEEDTD